jgi:DNA-binding Lrp family transcriptional regulator
MDKTMSQLNPIEKKLLNRLQSDFPICSNPFQVIADELAMEKAEVLNRLRELKAKGLIARFGGVNQHHKMGASTLAALKVEADRIDEVADYVNQFPSVNHNYLREHEYNLWFVVTSADQTQLSLTLEKIKQETGCDLLNLPMEKSYFINLAFSL